MVIVEPLAGTLLNRFIEGVYPERGYGETGLEGSICGIFRQKKVA